MTAGTVYLKQLEEEQSNKGLQLREIWEKNSGSAPVLQRQPLRDAALGKLREASEMVCIASNTVLPKEILQEIPKLSQRGVRVYLLLSSYEDTYNDFIANKAIVRIDPNIMGLMILADPKEGLVTKSGFLFGFNSLKAVSTGLDWYATLNGEQLKEAFHYFIWRFWSSTEEYRGGNTLSPAIRAPFDIYPLLEPENFFYNTWEKRYLSDRVTAVVQSARSELLIGLSSYKEYEELFPLLNEKAYSGTRVSVYTDMQLDHSFIKDCIQNLNISIYSIPVLDQYFVLADDTDGMYLSGSIHDQHEMGIDLGPKAVQDLHERLKNVQVHGWTFHGTVSLQDIRGEEVAFETYNRKVDPLPVKDTEIIDYGTIEAEELRQYFERTCKPVFNCEDKLARIILHRWKIAPKVFDEKAKLDPLYDQWQKETNKVTAYIEKVLEYADTVGQEKKAVLSSLLGRFFQRDNRSEVDTIIKDLEKAREAIKLEVYDWANLPSLLSTIEAYSSKLLEQQLELNEKKEYYRKKEEWQKEKDVLEGEHQQLQKSFLQLESDREALLAELDQVDPEVEQLLSESESKLSELEGQIALFELEHEAVINGKQTEEKVLEICAFLDSEIKRFNSLKNKEKKKHFSNKIKPYLEKAMALIGQSRIMSEILEGSKIPDGKENMKYVMKQLATHSELRFEVPEGTEGLLDEYKELVSARAELKETLENLRKGNKEGKKDNEKALQELDKDIKKADSELQQLNSRLEKMGSEFTYTPKKKETSLPFSPISVNLPSDKLPEVGTLYRTGKIRQLAIKGENELALGETESQRLNAQLVLRV
ncbi:TrmB family transcriptional regulator sugar-binding domain-containing protein [Mesobacillus harenae]|uniref:TrmB family transcriptional regulator sugar-binding domain-containing protein n=1 Tax=Mesobacillus harenae TaxID=2213203 RepID=UPI0015805432|nr:TrmB family transcriptional regulator sugar-binding domain-containing protein [Mesobacillus harenae]